MDAKDTKCGNCKCWRRPEDFVGARGLPVKRCVKCREKDARQKARPEVREKNNQRQREKNYSKTHRLKKLEEDPDAFRKRNAETVAAWRAKKHVT